MMRVSTGSAWASQTNDEIFRAKLCDHWLSPSLRPHQDSNHVALHVSVEILGETPLSIEMRMPDQARKQHPPTDNIIATFFKCLCSYVF
jgi:hypothetical protein